MRLGKAERLALKSDLAIALAVKARKVREPLRIGKAVNAWDNMSPRNAASARWGLRQGVQSRRVKVYI